MYLMDIADKIIYKTCPFVAGGMFIGSVYWTAVTYGAVTVMQVSWCINNNNNEIFIKCEPLTQKQSLALSKS